MIKIFFCLLAAAFLISCSTAVPSAPASSPVIIAVQFEKLVSNNKPAFVQRIQELLNGLSPSLYTIQTFQDGTAIDSTQLPSGSLILSIGSTSTSDSLKVFSNEELQALNSESFILRSQPSALPCMNGGTSCATLFAVAANADAALIDPHALHRGLFYGTYELLQRLGFLFMNPYAPSPPSGPLIALPSTPIDETQSPSLPQRIWHVHTQHPLELTDLFQGWGLGGINDEAGWQSMIPDYLHFLEWLIANKQNAFRYYLLASDGPEWDNGSFSMSAVRAQRLSHLNDIAHNDWSLNVGIVVPIAEDQQHAWQLLQQHITYNRATDAATIKSSIDFLLRDCNYDSIATETGFSEFTHPNDYDMLYWIDVASNYTIDHYGRQFITNVHCSTGQFAKDFADPWTGQKPLQYNFLPYYADERMSISIHTVQMYSLDDPVTTYGNKNYTDQLRFLELESSRRQVLWYPETAYWIDYDNSVPLFLPVYGQRRLYDLILLRNLQLEGTIDKLAGQVIFHSGSEWGYWFQDVLVATAAWNVNTLQQQTASSSNQLHDAMSLLLQQRISSQFFTDSNIASSFTTEMWNYMESQRLLLIDGEYNGIVPSDVAKRTAIAYLSGQDTWSVVGPKTSPAKLGLIEMRYGANPSTPNYWNEIEPLLAATESSFASHASSLCSFINDYSYASTISSDGAVELLAEICDNSNITALRASFVHALYDYVAGLRTGRPSSWLQQRLAQGCSDLQMAQEIVVRRQAAYPIPLERIAGWRVGPTVYLEGVYWNVKSLFFWHRDLRLAVNGDLNPCLMNYISAANTAFEGGLALNVTEIVEKLLAEYPIGRWIDECLEPPTTEPTYDDSNICHNTALVSAAAVVAPTATGSPSTTSDAQIHHELLQTLVWRHIHDRAKQPGHANR